MEVSYKRRFSQSYMILTEETEPMEPVELAVLSYNRIPGLLELQTEVADGVVRFWYNITGKHTLEDYLERRQVDSGLLHLLFGALEKLCGELAAYFLVEQHVLLNPAYVYLDVAQNSLEFVYLPGYQEDIRDSFQTLMEQLLRRLNHGDKQASAMAYEMYQHSLKREESFSDMLLKALDAGHGEKDDGREAGEEGEKDFLQVETGCGESVNRPREFVSERNMAWPEKEAKEPVRKAAAREKTLSASLRERAGWFKLRRGSRENRREPTPVFREEPRYAALLEPETPAQTEVLNISREFQGRLVYQGEGNLPDILLDSPRIVLGKNQQEADVCIPGRSVSRIHARLEQTEGEYYLEDLNSTNGTYVNGELLEYRQKVKLSSRDRVIFGAEEYIFM